MLRKRTLLKSGDPNTKLLLHFDNAIYDSSPYHVPVSDNSLTFGAGKFGQAAYGKALSTISDPSPIITPDWYISDIIKSDFTIECWINNDTVDESAGFYVMTAGVSSDWMFLALTFGASPKVYIENTYYRQFMVQSSLYGNNYEPIIFANININNISGWFHVALSRQDDILRLFVNDQLVGSYNYFDYDGSTYNQKSTYLCNSSNMFDELIISDIARYTSNFVPQTTPFS